jgi:branched-chain amino acid transport system permease protein
MKKSIKRALGILVGLILLGTMPLWVHSPYYHDLFIITIVNSILAITFLMMLRAGLISLGMAAFWGIGAYSSAVLTMNLHLSFWLALPLSTVITGIAAVILGYILIGSGSSGFTFVILSSVIGMLFTVAIGSVSYLGGYDGISSIPPPDAIHLPGGHVIDFSSKVQFFYLALFLLVVVILVCKALYGSRMGRAWTAIGLSPRLAESIGIDIFRYKMFSFVIASAIAGMIGSFYAHYESFVIPNTFNTWQNIYFHLYAILGGVAYPLLGPIVGAGIMTFLPESLRGYNVYAPVITGVLLILLILFLPRGILGLLGWRQGVFRLPGYTRRLFQALGAWPPGRPAAARVPADPPANREEP